MREAAGFSSIADTIYASILLLKQRNVELGIATIPRSSSEEDTGVAQPKELPLWIRKSQIE